MAFAIAIAATLIALNIKLLWDQVGRLAFLTRTGAKVAPAELPHLG